jgi:CIC family chloride channel protein
MDDAKDDPPGPIPISIGLKSILEDEDIHNPRVINRKRYFFISGLAILLGGGVSVLAKALVYLIDFFTNIAFYNRLSIDHASPSNHAGLLVILIPIIGGVVIGLMALYGSKAIRGHGIPEAMEMILTNESKINPLVLLLKPLSSAISIGTGGPFGAEGPIIATGGALGSLAGQLLKITQNERKILLAAGASAGMSAIFGTPVAAILLAIELLLFEFSPKSIIPVVLACITGAAGHVLLFSAGPAFPMAPISIPSNTALFTYSLIGLITGLFSIMATKAIYVIEDLFEKLPVHWVWWPAIGGIAVGITGYFAPRTLGVGYENIADLLKGNVGISLLITFSLFKFISWSISLGSGTSGGTLAPLLTIGGAIGMLLGIAISSFFPSCGILLPIAALIGMAAMFAGASRALLTSIIFAFEVTGQPNVLLPLLGGCCASYFISLMLLENTIMTEKIVRRGVQAPDSFEPDMLQTVTVGEVFNSHVETIGEDTTIEVAREIRSRIKGHPGGDYIIVVDNEGNFKGIVNMQVIYNPEFKPEDTLLMHLEICDVYIFEDNTLRAAVNSMARNNLEFLPVVSRDNKNLLSGILSYKDFLIVHKNRMNGLEKRRYSISLKRRAARSLIWRKKLLGRK